MSIQLNTREVLQIAIDIEKNGEDFYREAAETVKDGELKKLLNQLADWEKGHRAYFGELLSEAEEKGKGLFSIPDYAEEASLYLKAIADSNVFRIGRPVKEVLGNLKSANDILEKALEKEKDSVAYYTAIKYSFTSKKNQENIDRIIIEELGHIRYLMEMKNQLR